VEDLTKYVNDYPNCFPEVKLGSPPTEIGLPGLTSNECDMTEAIPVPPNGYHKASFNGEQNTMNLEFTSLYN